MSDKNYQKLDDEKGIKEEKSKINSFLKDLEFVKKRIPKEAKDFPNFMSKTCNLFFDELIESLKKHSKTGIKSLLQSKSRPYILKMIESAENAKNYSKKATRRGIYPKQFKALADEVEVATKFNEKAIFKGHKPLLADEKVKKSLSELRNELIKLDDWANKLYLEEKYELFFKPTDERLKKFTLKK